MTMSGTTRINVPENLFGDEEPKTEAQPIKREQTPLEKFLGRKRDEDGKLIPKKRTSRAKTVAASTFARTEHETREMMAAALRGDEEAWDECETRHLVALFAIMHEKTYGIAPTTSPSERYTMTLMMGGFVKRSFGGDMAKALEYFRWLWTREMRNEKWRRENDRETRRLAFQWTIGNRMLDDYRVDQARRKAT